MSAMPAAARPWRVDIHSHGVARVDLTRGEGFARGDVGEQAGQAVERASARIRAAVMDRCRKSDVAPAAVGEL
jgi:hypothetical protein